MNERLPGPIQPAAGTSPRADGAARVVDVIEPAVASGPLIYASPHSGRRYTSEFLAMSRLDRHALRQSEDGYVDLLFEDAPRFGSPLLRALFPRAYVDVNRARDEIDARMFVDPVTEQVDGRSHRVRAGLGVIPRIVADGHDIYARKLKFSEAQRRLSLCYDPYHDALRGLIARTRENFGCAVLIDCHSMPSIGGAPIRRGERPLDFVLGDRYGSSCAPSLTALVEQSLVRMGYAVSRNNPYAGGHVAALYGRPGDGVHVLQIEINRSLYLDESRLARHDGFSELRECLGQLIETLSVVSPYFLRPAHAAE